MTSLRPLLPALLVGALLGAGGMWWMTRAAVPEDAPPVGGAAAPDDAPVDAVAAPCHVGVVVARETVDLVAEVEAHLVAFQVAEGDRVTQGMVLAELDVHSLEDLLAVERESLREAQAILAARDSDRRRIEQEYQRRRKLDSVDLVSDEEVESTRLDLERAEAEQSAAASRRDQTETRVAQLEVELARAVAPRAPFDGTIVHRFQDPGSTLQSGAPILRLISDGRLVRFAVPPDEVAAMAPGTPVRIELVTGGRLLDGVIERVAPQSDEASGLIFVDAVFRDAAVDPAAVDPRSGEDVYVRPANAAGSCRRGAVG